MNLKEWIQQAPYKSLVELSKLTSTHIGSLYNIAKGSRVASSEYALKIEAATRKMNKKDENIPIVKCGDVSPACKKCPYYNK